MRLKGKSALITGSARGIGRAFAEAYVREGAMVAIGDINLEAAEKTASEIGGNAYAVKLDVTDLASIEAAVKAVETRAGGLDILINNAGYEQVQPSLDVDEAVWDRIVSTNLKGAFFCAQAAARRMAADNSGGAIINLCSLTSYVGIPTAAPYGSSKSGLLGMTRALATEWASLGIRVNAIAPGYFHTAMTDAFYQDPDWQMAMLAKIPQRRFGTMEDLAGAVVFLASGASAYVTGHCLPVDGGYLASI
ncbi:MAG: glucose 1-dehydrogenase [Mesorhizobium sp.]|nr:MAG: glucose 1-dehydrogenase [Mesorhizobium sp.]